MVECPNCKAEFETEESTCPECGDPLEQAEKERQRTPVLTIGDDGKRRSPDSFTKEDLIAGLRAQAGGTPMDDFLPSDKWEDYAASLLDVLVKKHLIFPAEIDRELKAKEEDE